MEITDASLKLPEADSEVIDQIQEPHTQEDIKFIGGDLQNPSKSKSKSSKRRRLIIIILVIIVLLLAITAYLVYKHILYRRSSFKETDFSELQKQIDSQKYWRKESISLPKPRTGFKIQKADIIETACLTVTLHTTTHLNIVIRDCDKTRYELPFNDPFPHVANSQNLNLEDSEFDFILHKDPFEFEVKRKSTNEVIFKWTREFVFTDKYIEFNFEMATKEIYGLGERTFTLQFRPGIYSLFIMDRTGEVENGLPGHNGQGHHPVYLMKEKSGNYHMNLLRNINSGEVTINSDQTMMWQLIGGVVDLNFFLGDKNPETAVTQYHNYIGGWTLQAFWTMGLHQHKWWGYKNIEKLRAVADGYNNVSLPVDGIWSDIEYLKSNKKFEMDMEAFPPGEVNKMMQEYKKRWVCVVDVHIPYLGTNIAVEHPDMLDVVLRDYDGTPYKGKGFYNPAYAIDFMHPKAEKFWRAMLAGIEKNATFSGLWLDANEITLFKQKPITDRSQRKYGTIPFSPGFTDMYDAVGMPILIYSQIKIGNIDT